MPFVIIVYTIFVLFVRPPKALLLGALAGGLVMALINALIDLLAYYASWWHYIASGLIAHLPLPFYLTPMLFYGAVVYMLIWLFSQGSQQSRRWLVWILLIGVPLIGFGRDLLTIVTNSGYLVWDSGLAGPIDFVLWIVMFFAGYAVFKFTIQHSQPAPV